MDAQSNATDNFSLIVDDIYDQKHSLLSSRITQWVKNKNQYIHTNYYKPVEETFQSIKKQHAQFQQTIHQLLRVINSQFQMLSKVKWVHEDNLTKKGSAIIPFKQTHLSTQNLQIFTNSLIKSHRKSQNIQKLGQFSSRFFAIISTELNQFKSFQSQIQNRRQRFVFDYKKQISEENRHQKQICSKNPAKYFCLRNLEKLCQSFQKQVKLLEKGSQDMNNDENQSLTKRKQILKDCRDNLSHFEQIYIKIFSQPLTQEIQAYFMQLIETISGEKQVYQKKMKEQKQNKENVTNSYYNLVKENQGIFQTFLQEITIGQWKRISIETSRKSSFTSFSSMSFTSHGSLGQETASVISNKQFTGKGKKSTDLSNNVYIATLTMDYKLIFRRENQRSRISKEYFLDDLRIKSQKDYKKIADQRILLLKDKKLKETIELRFNDTDKREELIMHIERFQDLRNSLKK